MLKVDFCHLSSSCSSCKTWALQGRNKFMGGVGFVFTAEDRSVLQNQLVCKQQFKKPRTKMTYIHIKELREKNECFNEFYYLFVKLKILVPRATRLLNLWNPKYWFLKP